MIKQKIRERELKDIVITNIILDCSCINYLDSQGVHAIETLYDNYKEMNISLSISFCKSKQFFEMIQASFYF
jgi:anti-anti-sigma regulatory factor